MRLRPRHLHLTKHATPDEQRVRAAATLKRRNDSSFVLFDVTYADGTRSSNRKIPGAALRGPEGDEAVKAVIEAQDREIGLASGRPRAGIKAVTRTRV